MCHLWRMRPGRTWQVPERRISARCLLAAREEPRRLATCGAPLRRARRALDLERDVSLESSRIYSPVREKSARCRQASRNDENYCDAFSQVKWDLCLSATAAFGP